MIRCEICKEVLDSNVEEELVSLCDTHMAGKLKVLELYAGTRSIGKAFEEKGHKVYSVEWDERHPNIDHYGDVGELTAEFIIEQFGVPDVIWASPDCTSYSVAGISHHRKKNKETGECEPHSEYAIKCDRINSHSIDLIRELNPTYYFIENPRGGMRKMLFMKDLPRYTVTYCQYGAEYMKATDIWTNHEDPNFKPCCKNGAPCHVSAPRGSGKGVEGLKNAVDKSRIPDELCKHIVSICEYK